MIADILGGALVGLFAGGLIWALLAVAMRLLVDWIVKRRQSASVPEHGMDPKWFADIAAAALTFGVLGALFTLY